MNVFAYLSPLHPPAHMEGQDDLTVMRERIVQSIMLTVAGLGIVAFLFFGLRAIFDGNWPQFFGYLFVTALTLAGTLYRGIPYSYRAGLIVLTVFGTGIYAFLNNGQAGDGKLYMLAFVVLTSVLLGLIPSIIALALSVITIVYFWTGMVSGTIPLPVQTAVSSSATATPWITTLIFTGIMGVLIAISLALLINNLQHSLQNQKSLTLELEKEKKTLQTQVESRTSDVIRRLAQIQIAADVSRQISSLQDPKTLLTQVAERVRESFNLYYVGVFLVNDANYAVLQAGTGEAGAKMIAAGHRLQVGGASMIGWCISNQAAKIALDVGAERVRFNNPNLPGTRSELALPILSRGKALGALTIQSTLPEAFDEKDIRVLTGIADSLAISLENATLFQESQNALDEIESLNKAYLTAGWAEAQSILGDLHYTYENKAASENDAGHIIQVPLTLREQVIGQITLETNSPALTPEQMDFVDAITTQTALALENARLLNESERRASQEETLNRMSLQFSKALNIEDILRSAIKELGGLPSVTEVSVHMLPEDLFTGADASIAGQKVEVLS